jgi:hypothetical protein
LGAFAHRIERLALRIDRALGVAFAKLAAGVAHRAVGFAETVVAVVSLLRIAILSLLTLLAFLAFLTGLTLAHAAFGQLVLQFPQAVAQALLVLLQVAHALIALLATLAVAT